MKKLVAIILAVMTFTSILPATASACMIPEAEYPYTGVKQTDSSSTKKSTTKTKTKTKSSSTNKKTTTTKTTTTAKKTK